MRGLAIEVDGDIHNDEAKMKKDELKVRSLAALGIGTLSIANWDFHESVVQHVQRNIGSLKPLESRERRRLWKRIYLFTLAMNLNDREFFRLFQEG
jgi:hypothetical protein